MKYLDTKFLLFVFAIILLSPIEALAGMNGAGNGGVPAVTAGAPRAGAAQNPAPQAGAQEGVGIAEERRGEVINADPPPAAGRKRYSFTVPVNVQDVPEGNELYVKCALARHYTWKEGSPVQVTREGIFPAVYGAKPIPLKDGAFQGKITINVDARTGDIPGSRHYRDPQQNNFHNYRCTLVMGHIEAYSNQDAGPSASSFPLNEQPYLGQIGLCNADNPPPPKFLPKEGSRCVDIANGTIMHGRTIGEPLSW